MDRYLQVINYNELSDYIAENKDAYIYVSVLENQDIRDFELDFKTTIIEKSLKNEVLYLDLTTIYNNSNEMKRLNEQYNINNKSIEDVPCILVFKDGSLTKIYDIKENNYNIEQVEQFLQEEGVKIDD